MPDVYCLVRLKVVVVLVTAYRVESNEGRFTNVVPQVPSEESFTCLWFRIIQYERISPAIK